MVNLSVASFTLKVSLLLVLVCWTTCSTGAAVPLPEKNRQPKEIQIPMKEVGTSLEVKPDQQDPLLISFLREKNERPAATAFLSVPVNTNQSPVAIDGLPSSCGDLKMIGHALNGIYFIMGSSGRMESVYCDFTKLPNDAGFQNFIGYTDVKSAPVHFYVQRFSSLSPNSNPIPFQIERLNEGNAIDLSSGIFTAPRPGTYFFSFAGNVYFPSTDSSSIAWLGVVLYLNGENVGISYVTEGENTTAQQKQLTLQSTLKLKSGDRVWIAMKYWSAGSFLNDSGDHYTHFTGFLLEEEL